MMQKYLNQGSGVAQLYERSILASKVHSSNPVIDKFYIYILSTVWKNLNQLTVTIKIT